MNYFIDPNTSELYAYDDEQVEQGFVKEGLVRVDGPPSAEHVWRDGEWTIPPQPVPQSVTMRQARLALFDIGKLDGVPAAIAQMPSPNKERAMIEWEYGTTIERSSALVLSLGQALDLDLDQLFIAAAKL